MQLDQLTLGPSERADVVIDYSTVQVPMGQGLYLVNVGPDEPYQQGEPGIGFASSNPGTTAQVMQLRLHPSTAVDTSQPPAQLQLPAYTPPPPEIRRRKRSLVENESMSVMVGVDAYGDWLTPIQLDPLGMPFGPTSAMLGTMDAHPIHIHLVHFQVVEREDLTTGAATAPEAWETGGKDTVIAYPNQITRVRATFAWKGLYVWHCHILEHEDNDMMRPFCVGGSAACDLHNSKATSGM